ncbi:hypothetical protein [Methanobacterium aggregans]|uniref:hypothetical protein n=1 Tax=Methanobacterium aggregans TaxID=1615586 RepID=UPI001AE266F6|nr:hypothetical protein [Methanobacterium aggregans]MBP2045033.1 hypothetical protein [Methanobacterium aggregans]
MEILWFYIAVVLAISDEVHSKIMWHLLFDFYILLAGLIKGFVASNIRLWVVHEAMEAMFHFVVLSLVFWSLEIGILAATIHMVIDLYHELSGLELKPLYHRSLHFVIESFFFIMVLSA